MSVSQEILNSMRQELESKIKQREGILDRLAIVDVEIDLMDGLIADIDADAVAVTGTINQSVTPVKTAYDARIAADCRTDLIWEKGKTWQQTVVTGGGGGGASFSQVTFTEYKVVKNSAVYDYEPYHGVKYYRRPSNRDYGSNLIAQFDAYVSQGSTVVGVNNSETIPAGIAVGDTLVDAFDNPEVFTTGDLPEIIGFGTTQIVGIVTTLVCGITTGSNVLVNFGAGNINSVSVGMIVLDPEVTGNDPSYTGILTTNGYTSVVGFGSTNQIIEYYDEVGILTTSTLSAPTLILDKPAANYLEEGTFRVGILTTIPAMFISTSALVSYASTNMYVIRTTADIDANFDYLANPNSPETIGILGSGDAGIGHSVFYDASGDPNKTEKWKPETGREEVKSGGQVLVEAVKEPRVGAGRAEYYIGTTSWPIIRRCTSSGGGGGGGGGGLPILTCTSSYAPEGTKVTIGGTSSVSIGYTGRGPSGKDPNGPDCQALESSIQSATNNMNSVINANRPTAENLVNATASLRDRRAEKETYAWSLLQASAKMREDIEKLRQQIAEMEKFDFSKYET